MTATRSSPSARGQRPLGLRGQPDRERATGAGRFAELLGPRLRPGGADLVGRHDHRRAARRVTARLHAQPALSTAASFALLIRRRSVSGFAAGAIGSAPGTVYVLRTNTRRPRSSVTCRPTECSPGRSGPALPHPCRCHRRRRRSCPTQPPAARTRRVVDHERRRSPRRFNVTAGVASRPGGCTWAVSTDDTPSGDRWP